MKQKFGKWFMLVPIGLFFMSGTMVITHFEPLPDGVKGLLYGVGFGFMVLFFVSQKLSPTN